MRFVAVPTSHEKPQNHIQNQQGFESSQGEIIMEFQQSYLWLLGKTRFFKVIESVTFFVELAILQEGVGMAITKEVLDELLQEYHGPQDIIGPSGLLKQLTKALIKRSIEAELIEHIGYENHDQREKETSNQRNGTTKKTLRTDQGPLDSEVPRDHKGNFEPVIILKHQWEFKGFDDKILSMYARVMNTREISGHLKEIYSVDVSQELISRATDSVKELLDFWRNRSRDPLYSIIWDSTI